LGSGSKGITTSLCLIAKRGKKRAIILVEIEKILENLAAAWPVQLLAVGK
jgi:hypothetical protein